MHDPVRKNACCLAITVVAMGLLAGCALAPADEGASESGLVSEGAEGLSVFDEENPAAEDVRLRWVKASGGHVPHGAVVGGEEPGRTLYICRAYFEHGWHPGKIVGQYCNFGWGGKEQLAGSYEVLVGKPSSFHWVAASDGYVPGNSFSGGHEPGRPNLYVCRAYYKGVHPGKLVGKNCNIGYGGKELTFSDYEVMVLY